MISKPKLAVNNLIMGTTYLDVEGTSKAINKTTGDTLEIQFTTQGWTSSSGLSGKCLDAAGTTMFKINGSWLDKITITDN